MVIRLNPGAVATSNAASVVGSPPQWADGSDATYASMTTDTDGAGAATRRDSTTAPLDLLADPASVTAITAHLRAAGNATTSDGPRLSVLLYNTSKNILTIAPDTELGWVLPNDGAVHDHSFLIDNYADFGTSLAQVATDLTTATTVGLAPHSSIAGAGSSTITVYEFWLEIAAGTIRRRLPHNRILQRGNDGLGITGGRRILGAKTIQSSNRRGPGGIR